MKLQVSELYEKIENAKTENKRYIFLRGSTRSGKTYAAAQNVIVECLLNKITLTIARATQVSLKATIIQDFKYIKFLTKIKYDSISSCLRAPLS